MAVTDYSKLETWQRAMDLAETVYAITRAYPKEEIYGLTSQTRRSAVSIPSNIARLKYADDEVVSNVIRQAAAVGRLLNGLIRAVAPPADRA